MGANLVVVCASACLQLLRNHVKTAYQDLEEYFGGEECLTVNYNGQVSEKVECSTNLPGMGVEGEMVVDQLSGC